MAKDRPKSKFIHISQMLPAVLGQFRKHQDLDLGLVFERWDAAVGPEIAKNARPAAFKQGVLVVNVPASAWIQSLQFLKADLMEKLNQALSADLVKEIQFKVGNLGPRPGGRP